MRNSRVVTHLLAVPLLLTFAGSLPAISKAEEAALRDALAKAQAQAAAQAKSRADIEMSLGLLRKAEIARTRLVTAAASAASAAAEAARVAATAAKSADSSSHASSEQLEHHEQVNVENARAQASATESQLAISHKAVENAEASAIKANQNAMVMIAVIGASSGIIGPMLLAWLIGLQSRRGKLDDYKRQDEVAEKAAKVARAAAIASERLLDRQKQSEEKADTAATRTTAALAQIHTLVNSSMTAMMRENLTAHQSNLILLNQIAEREEKDGIGPSPEMLATIASTRATVAELEAQLSDRLRQTGEAASQPKQDLSNADPAGK